MVRPISEGFHTVTPIVVFKDTREAIEFYKKAFGAVERYAMPGPDGKGIMHAEVGIGDSTMMMSDERPNCPAKSAQTVGQSPVGFYLYVQDVDAAFQRAVNAGASEQMKVQDMFWGDRVGSVKDPFGYSWMLATHVRDLTPEEIRRGAEAQFAKAGT